MTGLFQWHVANISPSELCSSLQSAQSGFSAVLFLSFCDSLIGRLGTPGQRHSAHGCPERTLSLWSPALDPLTTVWHTGIHINLFLVSQQAIVFLFLFFPLEVLFEAGFNSLMDKHEPLSDRTQSKTFKRGKRRLQMSGDALLLEDRNPRHYCHTVMNVLLTATKIK